MNLRLPRVAVVVLNFNGLKWLPRCLSSVTRTKGLTVNIYVVDNASTDKSVHYVRKNFPNVRVIAHSTNLGFAAAYNRALAKIEADYFVLLNNDTEVLNPNWVQCLVKVAAADPLMAAVSCKILSMEHPGHIDSVGVMGIPFWRGFVDIGKEEEDEGQYDTSEFEPFSFCGGAALLRRTVFEQVGGFDEKFFMYVEDVDLSWRLRLLDYRIGFAPYARVAHFFSGTRTVVAQKFYLSHRNLLRAILKNCGSSLRVALLNYLLFSLITGLGFCLFESEKAVAILRAIIWNLLNLRDTYARRTAIQSTRKAKESAVISRMYPKIRRYQPLDHRSSRQILDMLFEHRQSGGLRV